MTFHESQPDAALTAGSGAARQCLVTGGAGFIGHHLVDLLLDLGHAVRVIDLTPNPDLNPRAEFLRGSILDAGLVNASMKGVEYVFHLAADPNLWSVDKRSFFDVNYRGTKVVLNAAEAAGARRIVHTSTESILVGARGGRDAIDETVQRSIEDMRGAYCRSKFLAEDAAMDAAGRGVPVVVVNPTLPVGPGDRRLTPPTRMILDFLNGRHPAYLDFEMNLIDARDVARGHISAAETGHVGERYILGGENLPLSRLLHLLNQLTGLPMPRVSIPYAIALGVAEVSEWFADHVSHRPPRASAAGVRIAGASLRFDSSKARREFGLVTRPVRCSIAEEVAWLRDQGFVLRPFKADALGAALADGLAWEAGATPRPEGTGDIAVPMDHNRRQ